MENEQKDRWDGWIESPEYRQYLQAVENYVTWLSKQQTKPSYYTPHSASHCLAVEKIIKALIEKSKAKLSDLEKFVLFSATWTHDLGMFHTVADDFLQHQNIKEENRHSLQTIRDMHDKISAWHLSSNYTKIFGLQSDKKEPADEVAVDNVLRNYAYSINVISRFHRMKEDINDCPKERFVKGERIQTRLLAALLRLGDTLHVDSSRFDRRLYDVLQIGQFDRSARLHWLKSYVVSNVYLDIENETIIVNIDLPDFAESSVKDKADWEESVKSLQDTIISDIFDDVLAVGDVFREHGLRAYAMVKPNVSLVPGYPSKDGEEIAGIINDLGVAFSPNTSKVIDKALNSITSLCNVEFGREAEYFYKQMDQLLSYLKDILKARPCHVGLAKIIEAAGTELRESWPNQPFGEITKAQIRQSQDAISAKLTQLGEEREKNLEKLYENCKSNLLKDIENVILFAYSEMVIRFLHEYGNHHPLWKEKVKFHVLECSGKRRLKSNDNIEYSDGLYYAFQLSRRGFKNVMLLTDTSFGSLAFDIKQDLIEQGQIKQEQKITNSLVLFGVNGISKRDGACGHTSGHLMIAIVAEYFKIPVWVVGDSFKKGEIDWQRKLTRPTPWLTGQKTLLKNIRQHNIELINYMEDMIPKELIERLVTDDEISTVSGGTV